MAGVETLGPRCAWNLYGTVRSSPALVRHDGCEQGRTRRGSVRRGSATGFLQAGQATTARSLRCEAQCDLPRCPGPGL